MILLLLFYVRKVEGFLSLRFNRGICLVLPFGLLVGNRLAFSLLFPLLGVLIVGKVHLIDFDIWLTFGGRARQRFGPGGDAAKVRVLAEGDQ